MEAADAVSELDLLDPDPRVIELSSGYRVELHQLKTRQFMRLLKVLTRGAGVALLRQALDLSNVKDAGEFATRLITLTVLSIPEAEDEMLDFLRSMCKPHGLPTTPAGQLSDEEQALVRAMYDQLAAELYNPDPIDTIDIVEAIVRQEAPNIQALVKKVQRMLPMLQEPPDKKPAPGPQELAEQDSPPPSTSSPASTAGKTSTSSSSRSAGSARRSRPSTIAET